MHSRLRKGLNENTRVGGKGDVEGASYFHGRGSFGVDDCRTSTFLYFGKMNLEKAGRPPAWSLKRTSTRHSPMCVQA